MSPFPLLTTPAEPRPTRIDARRSTQDTLGHPRLLICAAGQVNHSYASRDAMTEYHGWVTLCCTDATWDDGRWGDARDEVERQIAQFKVEDGHSIAFAATTEAMQTLQLSGCTDRDIAPVLKLMELVGRTVPNSYGELVALEGDHPDLSTGHRYRLTGGRVSRL
jgi:hypothetical protein